MCGRFLLFVLLTVLVAETVAGAYVYSSLSDEVALLKKENEVLQAWLFSNVSKLEEINAKYSDLLARYEGLVSEHESLKNSYRSLSSDYALLKSKYDSLYADAIRVNSSLASIVERLTLLVDVPEAFTRVLDLSSVTAVSSYVQSAGVKTSDFWLSIQRIYEWIKSNVAYVNDVEIPYPAYATCSNNKLCSYEFLSVMNYVQEPLFTASYGQGDCDDQAVLAYAMIKYYMIFIYGKEYDVLLAYIKFWDGGGHLAVFLPVLGGKLTVIDPAGSYLTSQLGVITSRPALDELVRYSNHFSKFGGIKYMELYKVDVRAGKYVTLVSGDIAKVASYIVSSG